MRLRYRLNILRIFIGDWRCPFRLHSRCGLSWLDSIEIHWLASEYCAAAIEEDRV